MTADSQPVRVSIRDDGIRAYTSTVPPEALPPIRPRDLTAAWEAARERAMEQHWGEARFFRFLRGDAPPTELALADADACCWAAAIDTTTGLASVTGLAICLRLLALVQLIGAEGWARARVTFRRDGASIDPDLLAAAAQATLTEQGSFDMNSLCRQLHLPSDHTPLALGASA